MGKVAAKLPEGEPSPSTGRRASLTTRSSRAWALATAWSIRATFASSKGSAAASSLKGRPVGNRPGDPRRGRLDLIATLRTAAPWQPLRRGTDEARRVVVAAEDIRIRRYRQRSETTAIFCVDASGSAALERLAEAKGAVELLLAEAYVRRDRVALVAFRGTGAEVLLPPTRSLVRAKRALAGLPGGEIKMARAVARLASAAGLWPVRKLWGRGGPYATTACAPS